MRIHSSMKSGTRCRAFWVVGTRKNNELWSTVMVFHWISIRSHCLERAAAFDFKDASAPKFGHSDVIFCLFLVTKIKTYCLSIISGNAQ